MSRPTASFSILGPLRVVVDGAEVPIATRRQRALLVLLVMNAGRVVPAERLIDQLWDGAPPPQARSRCARTSPTSARRSAGRPGWARRSRPAGRVTASTYPPERRRHSAGRADRAGSRAPPRRAARRRWPPSTRRSRTWSGDPLADIADHEAVQSTITQLTETYLGAAEGRFEALLALGRHRDACRGWRRSPPSTRCARSRARC